MKNNAFVKDNNASGSFDALSNMQANKTSGNDGLSKEFYLAFFDILRPNLLKCLNYAFEVGELSTTQ